MLHARGLLLAAVVSTSVPATAAGEAAPARPSILLVTIDTVRADHVGCYGDRDARTPELDALAADGVRFDEARTHVPLTVPAHATVLTGLLPAAHGARANEGFPLGNDARTLAEALRARGYATAAIVSSVVLDRAAGLARGFDVYDDNQRVGPRARFGWRERGADQVVVAAGRVLERLRPPFFLWVHLYDAHRPWVAPEPFASRHPGRPYDAEIEFADHAFGALRRAAAALAGDALVVVALGDHGESLGEHGEDQHGYTLHRGVLRVPLIVAGAGVPRGVVVRRTVGLADVAPTLAALAAADLGPVDGTDLAPSWSPRGRVKGARARVEDAGRRSASAREIDEESMHPLVDSGWAPLRGLLTRDWHYVDAPRPELYDRRSDRDDRRDVARRHPAVVARLAAELRKRRAAHHDLADPVAEAPRSAPGDDGERLGQLASLGYVGARPPSPAPNARLDPKDGLPVFRAIEAAADDVASGRGAAAVARLAPWRERDPDDPRLWHALGQAFHAAGDDGRARDALRHAIALAPHATFIRFTLAALERDAADPLAEAGELGAILAREPGNLDATLRLATIAEDAGDTMHAAALLEGAYDAGGRDPELLDRLAAVRLAAGRRVDATALFDEALALDPTDTTALLETGREALRHNRFDVAIERLRRCAAAVVPCRIELARAYVVGPRDFVSARAELERARRDPSAGPFRRAIDQRMAALAQAEGKP